MSYAGSHHNPACDSRIIFGILCTQERKCGFALVDSSFELFGLDGFEDFLEVRAG